MALQAQILSAVQAAKKAFGDLLIETTLTRRSQTVYEPGKTNVPQEDTYTAHLAIVNYDQKEIDGDRTRVSDLKLIIFHSTAIPQQNDLIKINNVDHRIVHNNPIYVGSEIAVSIAQARPWRD